MAIKLNINKALTDSLEILYNLYKRIKITLEINIKILYITLKRLNMKNL